MHNPEQNLALGNWLLDQFGVARERRTWGGRVAAYAVGTGALALVAWSLNEISGRPVKFIH